MDLQMFDTYKIRLKISINIIFSKNTKQFIQKVII